MKDELIKVAREMRETGANAMDKWADRIEAIANAAPPKPVATVRRVAGSLVFEPLDDFYVADGMPLYAAPPSGSAKVLVEAHDKWVSDVIAYLESGVETAHGLEEEHSKEARRLLATYRESQK